MTTATMPNWEQLGLILPKSRQPIPDGPSSVATVLQPMVESKPHESALVGKSGHYTWREFDSEVNCAASALMSLGVKQFDRVAVSLRNDVDIVILFMAVMRLGAIWVGVNRPLSVLEKLYILSDSGCSIFIAENAAVSEINEHKNKPAELTTVLDLAAWRQVLKTQTQTITLPDIDPFLPAAIAYTSGTTGRPKGAVHSQHNLMVYGAAAKRFRDNAEPLDAGVQLPLTIVNLFVIQVLNAFQCGGRCICLDVSTAQELAEWVTREKIAHLASVPTIYYDLLHSNISKTELSSVKFAEIGGTNVPAEIIKQFSERFGIHLRVSYGMTEAPAAITRVAVDDDIVPGLIGQALPHLEVSVCAEDGSPMPVNEDGELCVNAIRTGKMANVYTPVLGYWKQPEGTAAILRAGQYRTGDMGVIDERGRLFICGRSSELILRGGSNVYPAEVERVLNSMNAVKLSAVFGLPDKRLGEKVVAAIQLADGAQISEEEIKERCLLELARYKIPEKIKFVEKMPLNSMQKIMKKELIVLLDR